MRPGSGPDRAAQPSNFAFWVANSSAVSRPCECRSASVFSCSTVSCAPPGPAGAAGAFTPTQGSSATSPNICRMLSRPPSSVIVAYAEDPSGTWAYATITDDGGRESMRQMFGEVAETFVGMNAPAAPAGPGGAQDTVEQLKTLADLHSQGLLTAEEFATQKAKLLG